MPLINLPRWRRRNGIVGIYYLPLVFYDKCVQSEHILCQILRSPKFLPDKQYKDELLLNPMPYDVLYHVLHLI